MALNKEFHQIIPTNLESIIFDQHSSHKVPTGVGSFVILQGLK